MSQPNRQWQPYHDERQDDSEGDPVMLLEWIPAAEVHGPKLILKNSSAEIIACKFPHRLPPHVRGFDNCFCKSLDMI